MDTFVLFLLNKVLVKLFISLVTLSLERHPLSLTQAKTYVLPFHPQISVPRPTPGHLPF